MTFRPHFAQFASWLPGRGGGKSPIRPPALYGSLLDLAGKKHIAVEMVGHTLVVVHDATHPDDKNWEIYLDALRQNGALLQAQLVVTAGGSPNAAQRRASLELVPMGRPTPPTAVVTSSVLVRGVVAALSWFMKDQIHAFSPAEFDEACVFIGAAAEKAALREVTARLRQTLH